MKFLHTMIRVKDIDASLKFYTEVLDIELDHKKRLDDCWLYFLNDKDYGNENDNSSVIYTELNNYKFLFMGDAGVEVEQDLIKSAIKVQITNTPMYDKLFLKI